MPQLPGVPYLLVDHRPITLTEWCLCRALLDEFGIAFTKRKPDQAETRDMKARIRSVLRRGSMRVAPFKVKVSFKCILEVFLRRFGR
jgi:hypothetical protein